MNIGVPMPVISKMFVDALTPFEGEFATSQLFSSVKAKMEGVLNELRVRKFVDEPTLDDVTVDAHMSPDNVLTVNFTPKGPRGEQFIMGMLQWMTRIP